MTRTELGSPAIDQNLACGLSSLCHWFQQGSVVGSLQANLRVRVHLTVRPSASGVLFCLSDGPVRLGLDTTLRGEVQFIEVTMTDNHSSIPDPTSRWYCSYVMRRCLTMVNASLSWSSNMCCPHISGSRLMANGYKFSFLSVLMIYLR